MRKFTKGALITCLVLFITAIILFVAGVTTSGTGAIRNGIQSLQNKTWFSGWNGFHFSLPFSDDNWDGWGDEESFKGEDKEFTFDENQVQKLSVDASYVTLDIQESDATQVKITIDGKKSDVSYNCKLTDGKVIIKGKDKIAGINFGKDNILVIKILLPKNMSLSDFEVDVAAGSVSLDLPSVHANNVELDVAAGDLFVTNLLGTKADITVSAGEMVAETIKLDNCIIDCGMGDVEIKNLSISKKLEAEVGMGNITIHLIGQEKDFNYDLSCGMGNLNIGEEEYSGLSKDTTIDNGAMVDVELECGMGNLEIYFK